MKFDRRKVTGMSSGGGAGPLGRCGLICFVAILLTRAAQGQTAPGWDGDVATENRRCLNCHGQAHIAELSPRERALMLAPEVRGQAESPPPPVKPQLYVRPDDISTGAHKNVACVGCHTGASELPHTAKLQTASCQACHSEAQAQFVRSSHGQALVRGDERAPTCVTCHGTHDILPASDRRSRIFPLNVIKICGDCHDQFQTPTENGKTGHQQVSSYLDSVHGKATRAGLAVSATCADCHDAHNVLPANDPQSTVNRLQAPRTCGKCHVGLEEIFDTSVHGELMADGDERAPGCIDCHTGHQITRTDTPGFYRDIVNECGHCHDKPLPGGKLSLYESYRRSYHGQVTQLGSTRAARCSDCHGSHEARRVDDPLSKLHGENRLMTCSSVKCHPGANENFVKFIAHADYRDSERYPLLHGVWLYFMVMMSFAFGFFGLHSVLWFARSLVERWRHGPHPKPKASPHAIRRFNRVDRINHALVIISFFGLTLTGLPLLYSDKGWAQSLAQTLGGVHAAGQWHRFFALMLIGNLLVHAVGVARRFKRHGVREMLLGPCTMLPRWKDVTDCLGMYRWFLFGGSKPRFDRWTYWEKFDYVAEVGGSLIIGLSGLVLWFPETFAMVMPGWMFNVATIVHGYEALLAIGFIFTIHFFNAHLRMEKFPVDDVMFTGSLPEEEFKHERGVEYERLQASGELDQLRVPAPPAWYRPLAVATGIAALVIGTTLVALIILAGLEALD